MRKNVEWQVFVTSPVPVHRWQGQMSWGFVMLGIQHKDPPLDPSWIFIMCDCALKHLLVPKLTGDSPESLKMETIYILIACVHVDQMTSKPDHSFTVLNIFFVISEHILNVFKTKLRSWFIANLWVFLFIFFSLSFVVRSDWWTDPTPKTPGKLFGTNMLITL